jgi:methyl-accepting chemotaxis protein
MRTWQFDARTRPSPPTAPPSPSWIQLLRDGRAEDARALVRGKSRQAFRATTEAIAQLVKINDAGAAQAQTAAEAGYRSVLTGIALLVAIALALGGAVAWWLTRSVTWPLREAADTADRIATRRPHAAGAVGAARRAGDLLRHRRMQQALIEW